MKCGMVILTTGPSHMFTLHPINLPCLLALDDIAIRSVVAMSDQRRIIVSIDFGTTYSGVAWAETSQVSTILRFYNMSGLTDNFKARCSTYHLQMAIGRWQSEQPKSTN